MSEGLVEFLRARMDEDEVTARAATSGPWQAEAVVYGPPENGWGDPQHWEIKSGNVDVVGHQVHEGGGVYEAGDAVHIARHDPARVLAEVEAKRRILISFEAAAAATVLVSVGADAQDGLISGLMEAVKQLASVWADHPDYREEWKP